MLPGSHARVLRLPARPPPGLCGTCGNVQSRPPALLPASLAAPRRGSRAAAAGAQDAVQGVLGRAAPRAASGPQGCPARRVCAHAKAPRHSAGRVAGRAPGRAAPAVADEGAAAGERGAVVRVEARQARAAALPEPLAARPQAGVRVLAGASARRRQRNARRGAQRPRRHLRRHVRPAAAVAVRGGVPGAVGRVRRRRAAAALAAVRLRGGALVRLRPRRERAQPRPRPARAPRRAPWGQPAQALGRRLRRQGGRACVAMRPGRRSRGRLGGEPRRKVAEDVLEEHGLCLRLRAARAAHGAQPVSTPR